MEVVVQCPHCGKQLKAPKTARGKRALCSGCKAVIEVPLELHSNDYFQAGPASQKSSSGAPSAEPPPFWSSHASRVPPNASPLPSTKKTPMQVVSTALVVALIALYSMIFLGIVVTLSESPSTQSPTLPELIPGLILGPPVALAVLCFYLAPSLIAYFRQHLNSVPILIVNIVFGWTLLGWVLSLAWAFSSDVVERREHVRHVIVREPRNS